jgi:hypothetical protein
MSTAPSPAAFGSAAPGAGARRLAFFQGGFFMVSGIWPVLDLPSFMAVTGPKTDYWLVRTVGSLLVVIGATLFSAWRSGRVTPEIRLLGALAPIALATVDIVYVCADVIRPIYLADAVVELVLAVLWLRVRSITCIVPR